MAEQIPSDDVPTGDPRDTPQEKPIEIMNDISSDDKLWVLLDYVLTPLLPILTLLLEEKKNRPFVRAHNAQALAWGLVNIVLGSILSTFLCGIPTIALWIIGIYWGMKGYQGEYVTIPFISEFVKNQGWA